MRLKHLWWSGLVATILSRLGWSNGSGRVGAQFLPVLSYREGALKSLGIPGANGFIDYVTLLNERDGGIHGVPVVWEECETVYDVPRGVECYGAPKNQGAHGGGGVYSVRHPARLCPGGAGHARPDPPVLYRPWSRGRLGWGVFP